MTDNTGFKYQLSAIPDTLEPGTYMVMAYVTDSTSRVIPGGQNYKIDGWVYTTFKIGVAEDTPRVAGDSCEKCHTQADWGSMYHRSYFDFRL